MRFPLRSLLGQVLLLALLGLVSPLRLLGAGEPANVQFDFALYFAPAPAADPEAALARLLHRPGCALVAAGEGTPAEALTVETRWAPIADYAPPGPDAFQHFAKGLSLEDGARIAQSERVFVLRFASPRSRLLAANKAAGELVAELAEGTGGNPWDDECRLIYSAPAWRSSRVATWQGDLPDMREHVTMHAYRNPELVRIITLGMRKFGLADLAIKEVPSNNTRAVGNLLNACLQRMAEGESRNARRFNLDLHQIKHEAARQSALENPLEGATGRILIEFGAEVREDGDPDNRIWRLDFPECAGTTLTERTMNAAAVVYGFADKVVQIEAGDPEMAAARARARKAFLALAPRFKQGLAPNERLLVKAPFAVPGGSEYMWVEVLKWKESAIDGVLENDAANDPSLRHGKAVKVQLAEVYDYLFYKADGSEEGNETGKVLAGREAR